MNKISLAFAIATVIATALVQCVNGQSFQNTNFNCDVPRIKDRSELEKNIGKLVVVDGIVEDANCWAILDVKIDTSNIKKPGRYMAFGILGLSKPQKYPLNWSPPKTEYSVTPVTIHTDVSAPTKEPAFELYDHISAKTALAFSVSDEEAFLRRNSLVLTPSVDGRVVSPKE